MAALQTYTLTGPIDGNFGLGEALDIDTLNVTYKVGGTIYRELDGDLRAVTIESIQELHGLVILSGVWRTTSNPNVEGSYYGEVIDNFNVDSETGRTLE